RLYVEWLEPRALPTGETLAAAFPVAFPAGGAATGPGYLATERDVFLVALTLAGGDAGTAAAATPAPRGGLDGLPRAFDAAGTPVASDDNSDGRDPRLTFQAPAAGTYYVGVSAAGNDAYDPRTARSGQGASHGAFDLHLSRRNAPLLPDLTGAAFAV